MTSINDLTLADIMSVRVLALPPDHPLEEAVSLMAEGHVSCVVVMDGRHPAGIVTERDLVRLFGSSRPDNAPLAGIMSAPVLTAPSSLDFRSAYHLLLGHRVRHLVVVDTAGDVVGIVSETDFRSHLGLDVFRKVQDLRAVMDTDLHALPETVSLGEAVAHMAKARWDYVIAMAGDQPAGIVTERDIPRLLASHVDPDATPLSQAMSRPVKSISVCDSVAAASDWMARDHIRHLVVIDEDLHAIGILSQHRLLERLGGAIIEEAWEHRRTASTAQHRLESEIGQILEATGAGFWRYNLIDDINDWDAALCRLLGVPDEHGPRARSDWLARVHPDDQPSLLAHIAAVEAELAHGDPLFDHEYRYRTGHGDWKWLHARGRLVERDGDGRPRIFAGTMTDVTARRNAQYRLEVEHQFARLLTGNPSREDIRAALLQAARKLPEIDACALLERQPDGAYHLAHRLDLPASLAATLAEFLPATPEAALFDLGELVCHCQRPSGHCQQSSTLSRHTAAHDIRSLAVLPILVDGQVDSCLYLGGRDTDALSADTVTALSTLAHQYAQAIERLSAQEAAAERHAALGRSEAFLRALVRSIPDLVWLKDPDGVYMACNPAFEQLYGRPEAQIVGKTDYDFTDPEQADFFRRHDRAAMLAGRPTVNEEWLTMAVNGYRGLFEAVKTPMFDETGRITGVLGIARDITNTRRVQEQLRLERDRSSHYLDVVEALVIALDTEGRVTLINRKGQAILGYTADELLGRNWFAGCLPQPEGMTEVYPAFRELIGGNTEHKEYFENRVVTRDGKTRLIAWHNTLLHDEEGRIVGTLSAGEDITEQRRIEKERTASEDMLRTLIDAMPDIVCFKDGEGRWLLANDFDLKLFQLEGVDYRGKKDSDLAVHSPFYHDAFMGCEATDELAWRVGAQSRVDETIPRPDGPDMVFDVIKLPTFHPDGRRKGLVVVGRDVTDRKRAEDRLQHMAHFDPLTQLPNRMLLTDRLHVATARAQRSGKLLAVCYIDLDGFKPVNDNHGHEIGDRLLIEVANRLTDSLRADDSVGRLGGDEFVLLLGELHTEEECRIALDRVLDTLSRPYRVADLSLNLSASIGVTLYPSDAMDSDTLLRHADQAMYEAKESGRSRYHFFDPERDQRMRNARVAHARIRQALYDGELVLHYQPKVNMRRGQPYGVEALIRWQHPERGLLAPVEFLPQVADTDIAVDIDFWVIEHALGQAAAWLHDGLHLDMSVNVTARTLGAGNFHPRLAALLARHPELPGNALEIEILESAALDDVNRISSIIENCHQMGVGFALDDFGTGYSSLHYLRHLPAGTLKIDQSFVRDMLDDPSDLAIVEGIIGLADAFQREVVAEGVESEEHGTLLLKLGCEMAQGYGIARPMPAADIPGWVTAFRQPDAWRVYREQRGLDADPSLQLMAIEHKRWAQRLLDLVDSSDPVSTHRAEFDLHARECRFGRWYYGPGQNRYSHLPAYRDLEPVHTRIHRLANELVDLCLSGDPETARARRHELIEQRDALLENLDRLGAGQSTARTGLTSSTP